MSRVLQDLELKPFKPLAPVRGSLLQTVAGVYWPQLPDLAPDQTHTLDLTDGDQIVLMDNSPVGGKDSGRVILLIHGLTGCYQSNYMIRLCRKFSLDGCRVIRMNLRGCGPGFGAARLPYHSGRSEDIREALKSLGESYPGMPVTLVGFSLGGNMALKLAGEEGSAPSGGLDGVVAVSPPSDLSASAKKVCGPDARLLNDYFVKRLRSDVQKLHQRFPDLEPASFPDKMNLKDFDDIYTAPRSGFKNAEDYYKKCSSLQFIPGIKIPTLILCSLDDPVVHAKVFEEYPGHKDCDIVLTSHGGHVGFLGSASEPWSVRWMDTLIMTWVKKTFAC